MSGRVVLPGGKGGPSVRPGSAVPTCSPVGSGGRGVVLDCDSHGGWRIGLLSLLQALIRTAWMAGLRVPAAVYGPARLSDCPRHFRHSMHDGIELRGRDEVPPCFERLARIRSPGTGTLIDDGDRTIAAMRTMHPPLTEAFTLRIDEAVKSVVFAGETACHPRVARFARDAGLLNHEAKPADAICCLAARAGGPRRQVAEVLRAQTHGQDARPRFPSKWSRARYPHPRSEEAARIARAGGVGAPALDHRTLAGDPACTDARRREAVRSRSSGQLHVGKDGKTISLEDIA